MFIYENETASRNGEIEPNGDGGGEMYALRRRFIGRQKHV